MIQKKRPDKILNVLDKIKECISKGAYHVSSHAFKRQQERMISLPECLHVLKTGYEEKQKASFNPEHNAWKYAIRGKTIRDGLDVRVIVAFDENGVLIITVMQVERL